MFSLMPENSIYSSFAFLLFLKICKDKTNIFDPTKQTVMIIVSIFTVNFYSKTKSKIKNNVNNEIKWFLRVRFMLTKLSVC